MDAKVVTSTRPGASAISVWRFSATSFSEGLSPSRRMLVESQTSASTPSSPIAVRRSASVGGPMVGVGSIFQSPEWTTVPSGVRIASAQDSGIEWATGTNSTSKGPSFRRPPIATISTSSFDRLMSLACLALSRPAANRVAKTRQPRRGHWSATAPMWSSCAWVMTRPRRSLRIDSTKLRSGRRRSTPGRSGPAKDSPRSTMMYFRFPGAPKP